MSNQNHYAKLKISEISPERDFRVRIMGFVVDKKGDTLVIDDGSGKLQVFVEMPNVIEKIELNQFVRVFGTIFPVDHGFDVRAEIVQDLSDMNVNLYKRVEELCRKWGCG